MSRSYMSVPLSDAAIVRRVLDGDAEAYALLVDRYSERCARYAARVVGNREDAEEAVQDAFVRAYRALGDYRERDRFPAWLFRILINQCRTAAQRAARREQTFPALDPEMVGGAAAPDEEYAERDRLARALATLRPEQREAVVLRLGEELTYDEMAALTGAGVSALKMRVARAVARLRELLSEVHCV
jgi:RNA polymerase sigma-70 factor (ECF subfamily)